MLADEVDKLCIDVTKQDHSGNAQGLPIGHPQAAYELRLLAELLHGLGYLRAAPMNDDGMDADIAQEHHILNEVLQHCGVGHDRAADLEDHDGIIELPNVRQSLNEHLFSLNCQYSFLSDFGFLYSMDIKTSPGATVVPSLT
ncbi:MAG: hypothetical protein A4E43_01172 [Methanosaeta sp. PtaB.Bin005]|nr:MAG: hypothetical protein A4E43_01172 [Methanosaeta sp. PtaB.Bin005]